MNYMYGTQAAAVASAFAFIFSSFSLYETVLKSPALQIYISPVTHLGRETNGWAETISLPFTISNRGAREGTVMDMELTVSNEAGDKTRKFYSAYFGSRPKYENEPFAPLAIAGRSSHSGTMLFYPKEGDKNVILEPGKYRLKLALKTRFDDTSFLDRFIDNEIPPIEFDMALTEFNFQEMQRGTLLAMRDPSWVIDVNKGEQK